VKMNFCIALTWLTIVRKL